jgi:hypothetical protein
MLTLNIVGTLKRPQALCPTCVYAVTQKGFKGEELTSCNLAGGLRELKFEVCECSAYVDNRIPKPERLVGFVKATSQEKRNFAVIKIAWRP